MVKIWSSFMYFMIYMALSESISDSIFVFVCFGASRKCRSETQLQSSEIAIQKLRRSTGFIPLHFSANFPSYQFLKTHNVWSLIFGSHPIIPNICYLQDSLEAPTMTHMLHVWYIYLHLGVSKNRGTPKSSHFSRVFHYKPSILGYHYFWKHPFGWFLW